MKVLAHGGTIGASIQAPAGNIVSCTLSSLRGDRMMVERNQVTLRYLILVFGLCCAWGDDRAAALKPAWGFHPQTPSSLRGGLNGVDLSCFFDA